jgi:hypothetical protein
MVKSQIKRVLKNKIQFDHLIKLDKGKGVVGRPPFDPTQVLKADQ